MRNRASKPMANTGAVAHSINSGVTRLPRMLTIFICFLVSGCITTQALDRKIRNAPHTISGMIKYNYGTYLGVITVKNKAVHAYCFVDPIYFGKDRKIVVFAPVDQEQYKAAIILSYTTQDTDKYLKKHGMPAELFSSHRWQGGIPALVYAGSTESDVLAFRGIDQSQTYKILNVDNSSPDVVGIILDKDDKAIQLRIGRRQIDKQSGNEWIWSSPYIVHDGITRPTLWERTWALGYLFTVPIDIVTLPIQIIVTLIASRGM